MALSCALNGSSINYIMVKRGQGDCGKTLLGV